MMLKKKKHAQKIIDQLKLELPQQYLKDLSEFESLVNQNLYRAAYATADSLCRKQDWHHSAKLRGMIKAFEFVF
jgi:hypothetical protein